MPIAPQRLDYDRMKALQDFVTETVAASVADPEGWGDDLPRVVERYRAGGVINEVADASMEPFLYAIESYLEENPRHAAGFARILA